MGTLADNFYPGTKTPLTSADTIARVRQETDSVLLGFSGKDSLAAYLTIRPHFERVLLVHRMMVPGLQFVERRLQYYERVLDTTIVRICSAGFYRMLRNRLWQPPHRLDTIARFGIPDISYEYLNDIVAEAYGFSKPIFTAQGVRAADSLQRRATCFSHGPINWTRQAFWPTWDLSHQDVANIIQRHGIKLPIDYYLWGTSFDGLRYFFLKDVKRLYPEDYATILEWFPFAELEFMRHHLAGGTYEDES